MNRAIKEWLAAEEQVGLWRDYASKLEAKVHKEPLPKKLREARPTDIVPGAIIWYKHGDEGHFWQIVDEPLYYCTSSFHAAEPLQPVCLPAR